MRKLHDKERAFLDAAKRACDAVNLHIAANEFADIKNKFVAIRLSDGGSDGVLYDSHSDAVRRQANERACAYVCLRNLGPSGPNPRDMAVFLAGNRQAYDAGGRWIDPDDTHGGRSLLFTARDFDVAKQRITPLFIADSFAMRAAINELKRSLG